MLKIQCPACPLCGKSEAVELTPEELKAVTDPDRRSIQDALPGREPSFRELLMTGTHPSCWDDMFAQEDKVFADEDDDDPSPSSCRYCGNPPGPVCDAYECLNKDSSEEG